MKIKQNQIFLVHLGKMVEDWDKEKGVVGTDHQITLDENQTFSSFEGVRAWLEGFGLEFFQFENATVVFGEDCEEPDRWMLSQIEDENGCPDDDGKYCANYDLYIEKYQKVEE